MALRFRAFSWQGLELPVHCTRVENYLLGQHMTLGLDLEVLQMGAIMTASLRLINGYTLAFSLQFSRFIGNYCHQLDSDAGLIRKPPNLELAKEKS